MVATATGVAASERNVAGSSAYLLKILKAGSLELAASRRRPRVVSASSARACSPRGCSSRLSPIQAPRSLASHRSPRCLSCRKWIGSQSHRDPGAPRRKPASSRTRSARRSWRPGAPAVSPSADTLPMGHLHPGEREASLASDSGRMRERAGGGDIVSLFGP